MTTTTPGGGTTLAEELEEEARNRTALGDAMDSVGDEDAARFHYDIAARLRARAERVRELVSVWENQNLTGQCVYQIRERLRFLCGPLSGPPAREPGR